MQVYSYVFTIVKNQSLAEEITQNTFYKAMTARRQYEGKAGELTWLCNRLGTYRYWCVAYEKEKCSEDEIIIIPSQG